MSRLARLAAIRRRASDAGSVGFPIVVAFALALAVLAISSGPASASSAVGRLFDHVHDFGRLFDHH